MGSVEYHLEELDIALDASDDRRILPTLLEHAVMDIGCGIGQTFIAMDCLGKICVGIDVDEDAIRSGIKNVV